MGGYLFTVIIQDFERDNCLPCQCRSADPEGQLDCPVRPFRREFCCRPDGFPLGLHLRAGPLIHEDADDIVFPSGNKVRIGYRIDEHSVVNCRRVMRPGTGIPELCPDLRITDRLVFVTEIRVGGDGLLIPVQVLKSDDRLPFECGCIESEYDLHLARCCLCSEYLLRCYLFPAVKDRFPCLFVDEPALCRVLFSNDQAGICHGIDMGDLFGSLRAVAFRILVEQDSPDLREGYRLLLITDVLMDGCGRFLPCIVLLHRECFFKDNDGSSCKCCRVHRELHVDLAAHLRDFELLLRREFFSFRIDKCPAGLLVHECAHKDISALREGFIHHMVADSADTVRLELLLTGLLVGSRCPDGRLINGLVLVIDIRVRHDLDSADADLFKCDHHRSRQLHTGELEQHLYFPVLLLCRETF